MTSLLTIVSNYRRNNGWLATFTKIIYRLLKSIIDLALCIIAIPFVLIVRIIRPFLYIKFGQIRSDLIGHFVFDTEYYLSWREVSQNNTKELFYFTQKKTTNEHWPIMLKRSMTVHPIVKYLDKANHWIPGWEQHFAPLNEYTNRDIRGILSKTKPHIHFTDDEIDRGQSFLNDVGMQPADKFICVIARDSVYKENYMGHGNRDWSYHSYRNSNIVNYQKTMNVLADLGYFIFRMGKGVSGKIDDSHVNIFDYANSENRSDFLDIFLFANSTFSVGSEAGIITTTYAYRIPLCSVNLASIEYLQSWHENTLIILKKYWLKNEKRFMIFKEIYESGAGRFLHTDRYEKLGIELTENTPDEILAVSMEMNQRLNGTWKTTEEDEALQKRFWDMFPKSELHGEFRSRIGAEFLRQNKDLLY